MQILDTDICTVIAGGSYRVRIAATHRAAALLYALGIEFQHVGPEQDSGRAWFEFEYSADVDAALVGLVDMAAMLRERQPSFGQIALEGLDI